MYQNGIKRILDTVFALLGILLCSWLFLILMVAIKLDSPGPVFFRQIRAGKQQRHFSILKFRTMYVHAPKDIPTHLLADPHRYITPVGGFLRKTSLDELPQLVNILMGHMSFVGPRPALWNQEDLLALREASGANTLRPGLTGWAQIHGRDELPISDKARLDAEYAQKVSFWMDVRCVLATVRVVFTGAGVAEGGTSRK